MTKGQAINYLYSSGFSEEQVRTVVQALTQEGTLVDERKLMVCAMEYIARQINDEDVFEGWLLNGVADGDIPYGEMNCLSESLDWYIEDEDFSDLMRCFLRRMSSAYKNGGLYCGEVCSGDRSNDGI